MKPRPLLSVLFELSACSTPGGVESRIGEHI
jgi:hypothetical protein